MVRTAVGAGIIYGEVKDGGFKPFTGEMFSQADMQILAPDMVEEFMSPPRSIASLAVGATSGNVNIGLRADGFARHTLLCGQSGSGKTYALGILVEQLLLSTSLPLIILDPNSDFIRLGSSMKFSEIGGSGSRCVVAEEYERRAKVLSGLKCMIYSSKSGLSGKSSRPLQIRLEDFRDLQDQATVLGLEPLRDAEEFYAFLRLAKRHQPHGNESYIEVLMRDIASELSPEYRKLALRLSNMEMEDWQIWAHSEGDAPSPCDSIHRSRVIEIDLGSVDHRQGDVVSLAVLSRLWSERESRKPVLVVIDEAHNLCPREPQGAMQGATCESIIRLAGEGRKYGIFLLLATQRPDKIHPNVLTQCENLFLMKMNSRRDLTDLSQIFSSTPVGLFERAADFQQGDSLVTGRFSKAPVLVKFGGRQTPEGGGDVPTDWASTAQDA
jgi:uncharacterized protein